jgi:hypothetical protein
MLALAIVCTGLARASLFEGFVKTIDKARAENYLDVMDSEGETDYADMLSLEGTNDFIKKPTSIAVLA